MLIRTRSVCGRIIQRVGGRSFTGIICYLYGVRAWELACVHSLIPENNISISSSLFLTRCTNLAHQYGLLVPSGLPFHTTTRAGSFFASLFSFHFFSLLSYLLSYLSLMLAFCAVDKVGFPSAFLYRATLCSSVSYRIVLVHTSVYVKDEEE